MNDRIEEATSAFMDEFCQPGKGVRDGIRAASAVLCDQGLRKWGDPPTKEEIKAVWDFEQGGGFPKGNLCDYGAIENVVCKWQELRAAALTRQAQDGPVIGDEQLRSAAKEMVNYARSRNVLLPREREIIDGLEAALAPRSEPESTQEPPSQQEAAQRCDALEKDHEALKDLMYTVQAIGELIRDGQTAACARINGKILAAYRRGLSVNETPASVQPSTDDVVERMCDAYWGVRNFENCSHHAPNRLEKMTAALAVARAGWAPKEDPEITPLCVNHAELWYCERKHIATKSGCIFCDFEEQKAGWHSWESVEKAIRDVMLFGQYGIHEKREFIKRLCTRLTQDAKAEPAERVTDPAVLPTALIEVRDEIVRAEHLHPAMPSQHHAYAVILEELDEFWSLVMTNPNKLNDTARTKRLADMRSELIQISAMCLRAIKDLGLQADAQGGNTK